MIYLAPNVWYNQAKWQKDFMAVKETKNKGVSADYLKKHLNSTDENKSHAYLILLGLKVCDTEPLLKNIEGGIPYSAFNRFQKYFEMTAGELAELLQISVRTLQRRKTAGKFEPKESDRLVRLSRVFWKALELFEGDFDGAKKWLSEKQAGLGNLRPIDFIKSETGAKEVENLIGRLEHGVFS
ncbi:DUF2384 domain-containing protein [candidate division WOR-3 bacterium]|nr:DUF2384 domain-containing protein [candidate division WOR-3 bacterium]